MKQRQLSEQFGVAQSTVSEVLKRNRLRGGVFTRHSSGRPRSTSHVVDRNIVRASRTNPRLSAVDISKDLSQGSGSMVASWTVRRRLRAAGLNARRPAQKPMVSKKNRAIRLKWAKEHLNWTSDQWKKVVWSDESKFMLFGSDGIQYVRRPKGT